MTFPRGVFSWAGRRVLVTGAAGFLGGHLCATLVRSGASVTAVDRVPQSPVLRALGIGLTIRVSDLLQTDEVGRARPEFVFHLAGQSHIAAAQADPTTAYRLNVTATFNVLEACRQSRDESGDLRAVVLSSSNHIYHGGYVRPRRAVTEADALEPGDVYAATKGCADLLARAWARGFDLPVIALRHLNAYGPADPHAAHLVTATILSLLTGARPVIRSDGSPVKGYLFVDDVIAAYQHAAILASRGLRGAYNVGGAHETIAVHALVDRIIAASGQTVTPEITGEDQTQTRYVEVLDDMRFRSTGWAPTVPLTEGLARTWQWYRDVGGMAWAA